MIWHALLQIFSTLLHLWQLQQRSPYDKDIEILLLRRQLAMYQHQFNGTMRPARSDKFILAALTRQFKYYTNSSVHQLRSFISVVQPETVLKWRRQLVKHKWTQSTFSGGRQRISQEIETLIIKFAQPPCWTTQRYPDKFSPHPPQSL